MKFSITHLGVYLPKRAFDSVQSILDPVEARRLVRDLHLKKAQLLKSPTRVRSNLIH
jgi:hypothetical protein